MMECHHKISVLKYQLQQSQEKIENSTLRLHIAQNSSELTLRNLNEICQEASKMLVITGRLLTSTCMAQWKSPMIEAFHTSTHLDKTATSCGTAQTQVCTCALRLL